jgi:molybdopterin synthase catalytic subunit
VFLGVVRDHAEQGAVSRLDYEAHNSLAHKEMLRILLAISGEYPGTRLSVQHRVGSLQIGDLAVVVAASAAHRAEAFAACRAAIDRIKESVPIWKKEWAPDGSALWVNLGEASDAAKRPG